MIPRRTLPPNALVIALSPLLDPRSVGALLDLRARGFDLAVIDISPRPVHPRPDGAAWTRSRSTSGRCGATRCAIACSARASRSSEWQAETSLQAVLEEVREFRRYARHARV